MKKILTSIMPVFKKEFVLTHIVKNSASINKDGVNYTEDEEHYNVPWYISFYRQDEAFSLYLHCNDFTEDNESMKDKTWSIQADVKLMLISVAGKKVEDYEFCFGNSNEDEETSWGFEQFVKWEDFEKDYMAYGTFTIEAHVTILKMNGITKTKLKVFDESMKEWSDIVLIVEDEKFYVSKLFLCSHSTYFNSLLLGKFKESKNEEVTLRDIKAFDFQNFLEVLHGESAIDDDTVEGILCLADMYDAPTAHRRCEEFLIDKSEKIARKKMEISAKYNLKRLKKKCISDIKTVADIRDILPANIEEMDKSVMTDILQKTISLDN